MIPEIVPFVADRMDPKDPSGCATKSGCPALACRLRFGKLSLKFLHSRRPWFKVGDKIAEWTITAIEENRVVLSHRSNKTATLALYSDAKSK